MNKTVFSLAFLAVSGGYVAYANHGLDGMLPATARPDDATAAVALAPAAQPSPRPTSLKPAVQPTPQPVVTIAPPVAAAAAKPELALPRVSVAEAMPAAPVIAPVVPVPAMPPLPRPRPADAPAIQTAQATTTQGGNSQYRDGTYVGTDENAYYGRVQVQVTVAGNQITAVKALDYPSDRRTSRYINGQALPMLRDEVIQAQTAGIDTISGATLTSEAYIRSLDNALSKAVGGNA